MTDLQDARELAEALKEANGQMGMGLAELLMILEEMTEEPDEPPTEPGPVVTGIWIGQGEILALPPAGKAFDNVFEAAQKYTGDPDISDQDDMTDVNVYAKALMYVRTGDEGYAVEVRAAIEAAMGTEEGSGILAVARNLLGYILAADIIGYREPAFVEWLSNIRHVVFSGKGPSHSIITCHEERPNNFGTHDGATRIAIALYLGDTAELERAAAVFKGWLGDRNSYTGFNFGALDWQADPKNPVGINPVGATRDGHPIGGVLPDDQRRGGGFTWPPPQENYVWEALQGVVVMAEMLSRVPEYADVWQWEDEAIFRAFYWLWTACDYPPEGDDEWITWIVNKAYGAYYPTAVGVSPGKGMGFTDWTHAN